MTSRIHQKLGTAGFVIAIVALVAALCGGAYAAKNGLTGKQKKEVQKIAKKEAKKFAGKNGAAGAPGPQGPAGPAGATGPKGDKGDKGDKGANGTNGTNGTNGVNGKSVELVNDEPFECPNEEGFTYAIEGSGEENEVCSSAAGGGLPATLGPEETETGSYLSPPIEEAEEGSAVISFAIPLAAELDSSHVIVVRSFASSVPAECDDGVGPPPSIAHPEADPGYLCVFGGEADVEPEGVDKVGGGSGASTTGAILPIFNEGVGFGSGVGTFAVTGALA